MKTADLTALGKPGAFRLTLRGVFRDRIEFRATVLDDEPREVSVLLRRDGSTEFPHVRWESGESLGVDVLDQLVRERAAEVVALRGRGSRR